MHVIVILLHTALVSKGADCSNSNCYCSAVVIYRVPGGGGDWKGLKFIALRTFMVRARELLTKGTTFTLFLNPVELFDTTENTI